MDTQAQLDRQFELSATSASVSQSIDQSIPEMNRNSARPARSILREPNGRVLANDEATTSAMNNLALKIAPQPNTESSHKSNDVRSPEPSEPLPDSLSEPPTARLRKRKSSKLHYANASAIRFSPSKRRVNEASSGVVRKPAPAQLSRPTDPLNSKKVQNSRLIIYSKDKFDLPDDTLPKALSGRPGQPTSQETKARGRPRKGNAEPFRTRPPIGKQVAAAISVIPARPSGRQAFIRRGLGSEKEIVRRERAPNNGIKLSRSAAPLERLHEVPGMKAQSSDVSRTKARPRNQDSVPPTGKQEKFGESALPQTNRSRVTRLGNMTTTGTKDLIAPITWSEKPEQWVKGQKQVAVLDESAGDRIIVPDSEDPSQGDGEDDVYSEKGREELSDQESNGQGGSPAACSVREILDQSAAKRPDDSEAEDQSSEDEDISNEDEDQDLVDEPAFELFGGTEYWNQIIVGAKTVGVSIRKGNIISRKPKIATGTGQELVSLIQEAETLYKEGKSFPENEVLSESTEQTLHNLHGEIGEAIDEFLESNGSQHERLRSLHIQDIYAHVIPAMVYMLMAALRCRSNLYSEPNNTESLEEMVQIQGTIIQLCEKARRWKATPLTKSPIKGPVTNKILPYLRDLKEKCFVRELTARKRVVQQQHKEEQFAENYRRVLEQKLLEKEQHRQRIIDRRRLIYRQIGERPKENSSQSQLSLQIHGTPRSKQLSQTVTSDQWTREQNVDLVHELLNVETRYMPGRPSPNLQL